jgi:hypothetical protein
VSSPKRDSTSWPERQELELRNVTSLSLSRRPRIFLEPHQILDCLLHPQHHAFYQTHAIVVYPIMVSFWDTLRTVALAACLVLLILNLELYLEHGYVPLPKTGVVGRLVSRIFHWKIHLIFHWALYWLFHWIFYIPSIIAKIRMKCNLQLCGYRMYARYWFYELRLFRHTHTDLIISIAILALYVILGLALWYLWVQEGSLRGIVSASLSYCIKVVRFVPERLGIISPSSDVEEAYDVNESYGDPKVLTTGLITDLKSIGLKAGRKDLYTLLQVAMTKGKPVDDKLMTVGRLLLLRNLRLTKDQMEKMIAITASLPPNSKSRKRLTQTIIHSLWDSLEHPPLSYMGEKFEYRTPDGSYNVSVLQQQNILTPHIGKAGTPYARSTRRIKRLHGVRPDPGLLFDCEPTFRMRELIITDVVGQCSCVETTNHSRRTRLVYRQFSSIMLQSSYTVRLVDQKIFGGD